MNNTEKPSKNLKIAAGLVASAAAATVAAMAYKVNEEKINAGIDKAAGSTKVFIDKASKKVKEVADDLMARVDEEKAAAEADEEVVEAVIVEAAPAETADTAEERLEKRI